MARTKIPQPTSVLLSGVPHPVSDFGFSTMGVPPGTAKVFAETTGAAPLFEIQMPMADLTSLGRFCISHESVGMFCRGIMYRDFGLEFVRRTRVETPEVIRRTRVEVPPPMTIRGEPHPSAEAVFRVKMGIEGAVALQVFDKDEPGDSSVPLIEVPMFLFHLRDLGVAAIVYAETH